MLNKVLNFIRERYGIDELNKFLFYVYFILVAIDFFINFYPLTIITFILLLLLIYRPLSKHIIKRQKENEIYLKTKNKLKNNFYDIKKKYNNRKTKIYKKCPKCKKTLRLDLPNKRGIKHIVCPNCKKKITMLVLRKQKIEVITNKKKKK